MERQCHHCGAGIDAKRSVGRRDTCDQCGWDLRCCRNCDHYAPGHHNDCREPEADRQVDKVKGNFCDFFRFRTGTAAPAVKDDAARQKLDQLFRKKP